MTLTGQQGNARSRGEEIPPQTGDAPGPDSPLELGRSGWRDTLRRSATEFRNDRATMTAGTLAYHWFLSLFPAIIALLGIARLARASARRIQDAG